MRSRLRMPGLLLAGLVALWPGGSWADDTTPPPEPSPAAAEMLKSMREKGILSDEEYEAIYRRQAKYEADQKAENSLPGWAKDWTFGGDFRLRFDRQDYSSQLKPGNVYVPGENNINLNSPTLGSGSGLRERYLMRLRLGAEKRLGEDFTVGFRLTTADSIGFGNDTFFGTTTPFATTLAANPRSGNTTLGNYNAYHGIFVDRAYLTWNPWFAKGLTLTAGKFANPFTDGQNMAERVIWDPDISPEGISAKFHFEVIPETVSLDFASAYLLINNVPNASVNVVNSNVTPGTTALPNLDERDPDMYGFQLGLTTVPTEWLKTNVRVSFYQFEQVNASFAAYMEESGNGGDAVSHNPIYNLLPPTDSLFNDGASRGRVEEIVADAYLSFTPFGERYKIRPFFSFSQILNALFDDKAYAGGLDLGSAEFVRLVVMYADVGRNGTVGPFIDDDIFDGLTNMKGWYIFGERALTSFLRLRVGYSKMRPSTGTCTAAAAGLPQMCDTAFGFSPTLLQDFRLTQRDRTRWQIDLIADF
ncbi:MAG TPA: putative porin [Myxococcota bacterium]|nr:putative porin [Myxococcota bacterium]